jgi:predicted DNA-binding protein
MGSMTTSIRLRTDLAKRLKKAAERLARGKNWIIATALEEYLAKMNREDLAREARRQSLVIARTERRGADKGFPEEDIEEWR